MVGSSAESIHSNTVVGCEGKVNNPSGSFNTHVPASKQHMELE